MPGAGDNNGVTESGTSRGLHVSNKQKSNKLDRVMSFRIKGKRRLHLARRTHSACWWATVTGCQGRFIGDDP